MDKYSALSLTQLLEERAKIANPNAPVAEQNLAELGKIDKHIADFGTKYDKMEDFSTRASAQRRSELLKAVNNEPDDAAYYVSGHDEDETYQRAFVGYLRDGMEGLDRDEQSTLRNGMTSLPDDAPVNTRALGVGSGAIGGYTVPEGFQNKVVAAMDSFGGLRGSSLVTKVDTARGNDLPIPTSDDTGNVGELLAENTQAAEQDVAFGSKVLKAHVWSSKLVKVSFQLLQDEAVDLESFLANALGKRIGRAQAPYLITGTGSSQPEGIVTGTTVGHTTASTQTTSFIYDDFVEVENAVDPAYLNSSTGYVCHGTH